VKASDYRENFEARQQGEGQSALADSLRAAAIRGGALDVEDRRELIRNAINNRSELPTVIPALIQIARDPNEPGPIRGSALASLKAASFVTTVFAPWHAAYVELLRELASDENAELRQAALEVLAAAGDALAREYLVEGLENPDAARVAPAKALQLLSYDAHGDYAPLARAIVARTEDAEVKAEAVRLLGADPGSADLLREIRATCLGALAHVQDYASSRRDHSFSAKVAELEQNTASSELRSSAEQFLQRDA
jgi:HEAT repeat protein